MDLDETLEESTTSDMRQEEYWSWETEPGDEQLEQAWLRSVATDTDDLREYVAFFTTTSTGTQTNEDDEEEETQNDGTNHNISWMGNEQPPSFSTARVWWWPEDTDDDEDEQEQGEQEQEQYQPDRVNDTLPWIRMIEE